MSQIPVENHGFCDDPPVAKGSISFPLRLLLHFGYRINQFSSARPPRYRNNWKRRKRGKTRASIEATFCLSKRVYALRPSLPRVQIRRGGKREGKEREETRREEKDQDLGDRVTPRRVALDPREPTRNRKRGEAGCRAASVTQSPLCVPDLPSFFIPHHAGSVADTQPPPP